MRTSLGSGESAPRNERREAHRKTRAVRDFALVACILSVEAAGAAADWHVSPLETPPGDGSEGRPWDLQTALDQPPAVQPGHTIWLGGGRYGNGGRTKYLSSLAGTPALAIVVRGRPGERVVVDGEISTLSDLPASLPTKGSFTWFRDFEVTNSYGRRRTDALYRRGGATSTAGATASST